MKTKPLNLENAGSGNFLLRVGTTSENSTITKGKLYPILRKEEFSLYPGAPGFTEYVVRADDGGEFPVPPMLFHKWSLLVLENNEHAIPLLKEEY